MKKKFEITKSFVIKTALFSLLGILAFVVGFANIDDFLPTVFCVGLFCGFIVSIIYFIKKKHWGYLNILLAIVLMYTILILFALFAPSYGVLGAIILNFRNARSIIFIFLFSILIGLALLNLIDFFLGEKIRKLGLFLFFISLTAITAIAGQIMDYIAQKDAIESANNARGASFYGDILSDVDISESYNTNKGKHKTRPEDYRAVPKYGIGISRRDRSKSYYNNKGK